MDTTTFPFGYRFNFTFPQEIAINGKQLKGNIPYEFKIKKGTGNSLTLEQAWTDDNVFTKKAGLSCGTNKECTVSTETQKLNVKLGHQKKEGITNVTTGKIKVEKEQEGYNQGLKFSIDGGNAGLTGGTGDDITKLEELETYEIAEYEGKYYLTKKTSPDDLIKSTLVLPSGCKLPTTDASVSCTLTTDDFKKINFEGKGSDISASGDVTLTISKANSTDFPFGYKFTFSSEKEATVTSTNKIKAKIPKDFKIKKGSGTGQSVTLSLEKAWDDSKYSLAAKVGLTCTGSTGDECCSQTAGTPTVKLNVKKGSDIKEGIDTVSTTSTAKIKVEKDKEGYNQGLKFTITGGDVSLTGGTKSETSQDFSSLEEFETYEITEDKGKYYLTRKTSKEDVLKTSLSIPEGCFTSLGTSCTLTSDQLKNIKFEGKDGSFSPSGNATLTITKANSTDFPLGYRFTLQTEQEITIKSSDIKVKAKIPTDFKIKKNQSTPTTLSLEKAWTDNDYSFAKKAGLQCTAGNGECCSLSSGSNLNVKKGNDKKDGITGISAANSGSGKIKVEKEQAGYNQGLKFTITGGDVSLTGGNKVEGSASDITTLDEYETYEITEEGGKYYLTRKDEAIKTIETQLGLGEAGCSLSTFPSTCTLDTTKIKKINFDGKETNGATLASGTATLTISKTDNKTDFPLGYKFTLKSTTGDINIKNNTNVVKKGISTDFKIKKGTNPMSLEKAWDMTSLGKKVGLTCNSSSSDECSIANSGSQLKVRQNNNGTDVKDENLTKKSSSGSSAKIKVTKDQEGYNQGFKFTVEGGSIELNGSTASYGGDKINILDEYETYEIKEDGGKWYLTRKEESIIFIKKQLGLDFCTDNKWSRLDSGHSGSSISLTCNFSGLENLKKIKFNNSNDSFSWPTEKIELTLEMKKSRNSSENFGEWEVTISDNRDSKENTTSVCIPDGSGGKVDVKTTTGGVKYKINKNGGGTSSWCLVKNGGSNTQCK